MVRTADHAARRAQIVGAVKRLMLEVGLSHITIAGVAQSADISVGLVQHYYSSKEELLLDTYRTVCEDVLARVDAAVVRAERRHERIEQMLLDALDQFLPLTKKRADEVQLVHAFAGAALENAALQPGYRAALAEHQARAERALENGKLCGEVDPSTDSRAEAYALLALTDGLAARLLVQKSRAQQSWARAALAREAARLFPGECRRHGA
ncbi:TetR/AcrR family transcriptional regulator [Solicola gregarius]|uniref:TetR/AcrR family transcriptional regulator n=1 Tax=Solicola gregarius TaxID=2908642 RepID=A0AA46TF31_9ACTN|nr:TetR/AcrR family transcriptional regulator [Solicola gregarius]UYM04179.1 TetR/AcrR family transcriptional regulator [Solicola gregarius]